MPAGTLARITPPCGQTAGHDAGTGLACDARTGLAAAHAASGAESEGARKHPVYAGLATRRPWTIAALLCAAALSLAAAVSAQTPPANTDSRRVTERIRALQREAEQLARSSRTLLAELRGLEVERNLRVAEREKADAAVADTQARLRATDARLKKLEQERVEQLPGIEAQLVDIYKHGTLGYARALFGASDVRELGRASRTIAALVARDQRRLEQHRRTLAALREERQAQDEEASRLRDDQATAVRTQAAAQRAVAAHAARLSQIDSERDLTAQYVGELQVARDTLVRQLEGGESSSNAGAALPLAPFRGALEWPAAGRLAAGFGQSGNRLGGSAVRNGIELSAAEGTSVRTVHGGTVAHADPYPGFGNLVIVDHGANQYTLYGYLGAMTVTSGQKIAAGTEVGIVGPSPAGPPALYFELRVDGRSVDPVQWLKPR
jgi:septal ring factor EnvC (AmiA/AmiB activator)